METAKASAPLTIGKSHSLFREEAVQSHLYALRESEVLRISPPWARGLLAVATLLVAVAIGATFVLDVEQTSRARGVLRVAGGAQSVVAQSSGVVLELGGHSGDVVAEGALLARIDSAATKTALLEAERQTARAEQDVKTFLGRRDKEQAERIALLRQRAGLVARRAQNQRGIVARLEKRLASFDRLADAGVASALDRNAAEGDVAVAQGQLIQLEEETSAQRLQLSNISAELASELDRLQAEVKKARDRREALGYQLQQTEVHAPQGGRLEALVAKVGDNVALGAVIARLVPEGTPRQVVVFVPEADRAFLREGSRVRIELDQLPAGEFGSLQANVRRIAADLASSGEVTEALGDTKLDAPSYRVELELDGERGRELDRLLRPGSLVTARFVLRKRRLAALLFEPLKRFLDAP